jgi:hypothetical protein
MGNERPWTGAHDGYIRVRRQHQIFTPGQWQVQIGKPKPQAIDFNAKEYQAIDENQGKKRVPVTYALKQTIHRCVL